MCYHLLFHLIYSIFYHLSNYLTIFFEKPYPSQRKAVQIKRDIRPFFEQLYFIKFMLQVHSYLIQIMLQHLRSYLHQPQMSHLYIVLLNVHLRQYL